MVIIYTSYNLVLKNLIFNTDFVQKINKLGNSVVYIKLKMEQTDLYETSLTTTNMHCVTTQKRQYFKFVNAMQKNTECFNTP